MDDSNWLAERFDENRRHLRAVAYRMLGSTSEADDAVQEAWLKTSRADTHEIENLRGWLTTVVARVCLDMLRSRKARPQESLGSSVRAPTTGPDAELAIADAIGPALQIVLDMLSPAERVAFVLHDLFDLPFEVIGPIIDRTPAAARQLASRARRRVRGVGADGVAVGEHREIVSAFLAASRSCSRSSTARSASSTSSWTPLRWPSSRWRSFASERTGWRGHTASMNESR